MEELAGPCVVRKRRILNQTISIEIVACLLKTSHVTEIFIAQLSGRFESDLGGLLLALGASFLVNAGNGIDVIHGKHWPIESVDGTNLEIAGMEKP